MECFPVPFQYLILRQEDVGKKKYYNWEKIYRKELGREFKNIIWERDPRDIGKILGRYSKRHRKVSRRHWKAQSEKYRKTSESIGKVPGRHRKGIEKYPKGIKKIGKSSLFKISNKIQTVFIFGFKTILSENYILNIICQYIKLKH